MFSFCIPYIIPALLNALIRKNKNIIQLSGRYCPISRCQYFFLSNDERQLFQIVHNLGRGKEVSILMHFADVQFSVR